MKITLAYLTPLDEWVTFGPCAKRFVDTYRQFPPQIDHELLVVGCNGTGLDAIWRVFKDVSSRFETYHGRGRDCGAGQTIAHKVDCDFLVLANAGVYFHRDGWLRRFAEARMEHGEGLYGASASYESYPYSLGRLNPHIRTAFYGCNPKTFRQYPFKIDTHEKCFKFESGEWKFLQWFEDRGEPSLLVTWDGCYQKQDFRKPPNVFRKGDQSGNIVYDRHTEIYELANWETRRELEAKTNGGLPLY